MNTVPPISSPLSAVLSAFVQSTPADAPESLRALARAFIRHDVIAPEGVHLGGGADLKSALKNELARHAGKIGDDNALRGMATANAALAGQLQAHVRRRNSLLLWAGCGFAVGMGLVVVLASGGALPGLLLPLMAAGSVAALAALPLWRVRTEQSAAERLEAELLRFKLLEARLQLVLSVAAAEQRDALLQMVAQRLLADGDDATQLVQVFNWGQIERMSNVNRVGGDVA